MSISRRPSLPSGHPVPGFSTIDGPLHIDGTVEVYSLVGDPVRVLVHVRGDSEAPSVVGARLASWWDALGEARVTIAPVPGSPQAFAAVVQVTGRWLGLHGAPNTQPMAEHELLALLSALCKSSATALSLGGEPLLVPSLVWSVGADGGEGAFPIYLAPSASDEARLVRDVGRFVYELASGIKLVEVKGPVPPLSNWVRSVGPTISEVLRRCLSTGPDRVSTLADLARRAGSGASPESPPVRSASDVTPRAGKGLSAVAGMHELKSLLEKEVVAPIRDPEPYKRYGLGTPNGVLLYGPPGCGKTWIARKLAEEVGHFYVEIIPSEIASPYIHDSVLRIRRLFDTAAENAPAIVFIDEFEALAPSRADLGGHQQYKSEEVNEFLAHLNACSEKGVFVIAATNEPQKIDPAIRRTGRLDKIIYVGPPDPEARTEMLRMHLAKRPVASDLDFDGIAMTLEGYSASDIRFLVDEAARGALELKSDITNDILVAARTRVPASVKLEDEERFKSFMGRG